MSDLVTITNGAFTARINPLGAELWSLTDPQGREYMTDADPAFWTGHAPLLFPIVGALRNGTYRLDGRDYALPKHGFARTSRFTAIETLPNYVRFRLVDSEATRAVYPFAFAIDAEFGLAGATLAMRVTVHNTGERPLPFSFGFHPAFAWPLPDGGAKAGHRVVFARDEPAPVRRIDPASGTLRKEPEATPVTGRELVPDARLFEADALIWDRLASRSLTFAGETGPSLAIDFPDCPNLGLWQKPGAPFLAIEPWQGFNDPEGFAGELCDKPGIVILAPDAERRFRLDVTVRNG
jgi:galactose mutarotase-like enzyme